MPREMWKCYRCGYEWFCHSDLESSNPQCPRCRSYYTLSRRTYDKILDKVLKATPENPGSPPFLLVLGKILEELGIRFRPLATLTLTSRIIEDVRARRR